MSNFITILFYKFVDLTDPNAIAEAHRTKCKELGLLGRMIVAEEGVNATFEGTREAIDAYKEFVLTDPLFAGISIKESASTGKAFPKLTIKVRKEIVTLGAGRFDIKKETAKELPASELERWYQNNEDFVVLDLRNDYETATGVFEKTIDPQLANFRDLSAKLPELAHLKDKKVVAVCTGGIRCEKATCLLQREGFTNVYQLKDGIHTYMQQYPGSHFKGTLFVFDNRMTTDVVEHERKAVIGTCTYCETQTEDYYSDDSVRPSKKILCCEVCVKTVGTHLRSSKN